MSATRTDADDMINDVNPRYLNRRKKSEQNESFAMFSMLNPQLQQRCSDSEDSVDSNLEDDSEPNERSTSKLVLTIVITFVVSICTSLVIALSKITLVSITGRVFSLSNSSHSDTERVDNRVRTVLWTQLILLMIIPEAISVFRCFIWGIIGKSSKSFPCPGCKAVALGLIRDIFEIGALCGFLFVVAGHIPPLLTILLLNGCFGFHIIFYVANKLWIRKKYNRYSPIPQSKGSNEQHNTAPMSRWQTIAEFLGFTLQISIPLILVVILTVAPHDYPISVLILIPLSLFTISCVWPDRTLINVATSNENQVDNSHIDDNSSFQETQPTQKSDHVIDADYRPKQGAINGIIRILLIPLISFGLSMLSPVRGGVSFDWTSHEVSIFLTHVSSSFFAYVLVWISCTVNSWAFTAAMLLSTPISVLFIGIVLNWVKIEVFPFIGEYFVATDTEYYILLVAALLYISQILAYIHHVIQNSSYILISDVAIFWMPRYNSLFLEQFFILNRKSNISGYALDKPNITKMASEATESETNFIFICSTMYHESVREMEKLLHSIYHVATSTAEDESRNLKFQSHIFFDDACTDVHLNHWAVQLLALFEQKVKIKQEDLGKVKKITTPYGMQLRFELGQKKLQFYVHLKDNNKVKNRKRWSQVMYMYYVLKFHIQQYKLNKNRVFILTTDADVDFKYDSVLVLFDILVRNRRVGAVCARTHPLGTGPVVWYQKFDYTIGHWFQKSAEHILGCVLCCPGCFSMFRGTALKSVLKEYRSDVDSAVDFLTKDMGEDRWLCTLLVQKGWRLEYSAVSQDTTNCPESFEEFYKQRRRWIPSTMANLAKVITNYNKITANNNSITIMFILYQLLILFSTMISPATVILIIATGLKAINSSLSDVALVIVLSVISILYGMICLYAEEKIQINFAKILTAIFAIIMAIVISGILSETVNDVIGSDHAYHTNNSTGDHFMLPVGFSSLYLGMLAAMFIIAGVLHLNEILDLFHFIWYLLCLPSGYLFLMIYAFSNINNRSWGTREGAIVKESESIKWFQFFQTLWYRFLGKFKKFNAKQETSSTSDNTSTPNSNTDDDDEDDAVSSSLNLSSGLKQWLEKIGCDRFENEFKAAGYTEKYLVSTMTLEDIEAIGIHERGYKLKLLKKVKTIATPKLITFVPDDWTVEMWLEKLKMPSHIKAIFKDKGYTERSDLDNLIGIDKKDLQEMGITKRAHINWILRSLNHLQDPSQAVIQNYKTRRLIETAEEKKMEEENEEECKFWNDLRENYLKPESDNFNKIKELKQKLKDLRNYSLLVLLITNIMWIVFLYTLAFPQLAKYNLPDRAVSLLFLAVFSIILLIQFISMLFHRLVSLLHFLAASRAENMKMSKLAEFFNC